MDWTRVQAANRNLDAMRNLKHLLGPDDHTLVIPLCEAYELRTDGTTSDLRLDVTNDLFAGLGPYVTSWQILQATESRTTNQRWKVVGQTSTTGRTYGALFDLCGYITANGESAEAAVTSTAAFNRFTRMALATSNVTGTATELAIVWVYLVARLRS